MSRVFSLLLFYVVLRVCNISIILHYNKKGFVIWFGMLCVFGIGMRIGWLVALRCVAWHSMASLIWIGEREPLLGLFYFGLSHTHTYTHNLLTISRSVRSGLFRRDSKD